MGFQFRKLLPSPPNGTDPGPDLSYCIKFCSPDNVLGCCEQLCFDFCSKECPDQLPPPPPRPSPPLSSDHHPNKLLISSVTVAAVAFVIACCYIMYVKFYSNPRGRRRRESLERRNETHEEFLDEDHGPVIDHPIWYIRTVGLQPSIISSITVCKYKRGDGLVEGTDCSVCLSEFQEDETLRLLPKCSHAFHIPCIDTWLRSHTNCPLCRAPIVTNMDGASSSESNVENLSGGEETHVEILGIDAESERDRGIEEGELSNGAEGEPIENRIVICENNASTDEDGIQPMRRSMSLDSLSAFKISQAIANQIGENDSRILPKRLVGTCSLLKLFSGSSVGRSLQIGPSSLKRSFSCTGKLFMSRGNQGRNSVLRL